MKDEAIYFKTPAGEEAVQDRTRLVQRNLRMVLILVDGVVNVGTLKDEVGDPVMVESAIAELERLGLIETASAHTSREVSEIETLPVLSDVTVTGPLPGEVPLVQADTVFDEETAAQIQAVPRFLPPEPPAAEPAKPPKRSPLTDISDWWEAARKERAQAREEAIYEEAYGRDVPDHIEHIEHLPPPRKVYSLTFRWSWLAMGIVGVVAILLLVVVLFPYDNYRPDFERRLSAVLADEVRIGEVRIALLPYPAITLDRVTVGADPYLSANQIRLLPEIGSLFGPRYREVQIDGVRVKESGLSRFSNWFQPSAMGDAVVGRLEISGLALDLAGDSIEGLQGSARIDEQKGLLKFVLRATEGDLRVEVIPGLAGVWLNMSASGWKAPFKPELAFSFIELRGELVPGRLTLNNIDGRLYDGGISGSGTIVWMQEPTLALKLDFQRLAVEQLLPALGVEAVVDGSASGKLQVASKAMALHRLDDEVKLDGTFALERGSLKRVDLTAALRANQRATLRGGTTSFQEFSGTFAVDGRTCRFGNLRLASGLMRASGQVSVVRGDKVLSGNTSLEMRGSVNAARASATVSGTVQEPELRLN